MNTCVGAYFCEESEYGWACRLSDRDCLCDQWNNSKNICPFYSEIEKDFIDKVSEVKNRKNTNFIFADWNFFDADCVELDGEISNIYLTFKPKKKICSHDFLKLFKRVDTQLYDGIKNEDSVAIKSVNYYNDGTVCFNFVNGSEVDEVPIFTKDKECLELLYLMSFRDNEAGNIMPGEKITK